MAPGASRSWPGCWAASASPRRRAGPPPGCSARDGVRYKTGMFSFLVRAIFGTKHERDARRMRPTVDTITGLEPEVQRLSDVELRAKTDEFRKRLADGEAVEELLVEAFAVCREAARRTVRMRHFDVQIMGGIVLHEGKIAEMATGEGKTLVATLPAYLNALPGLGT